MIEGVSDFKTEMLLSFAIGSFYLSLFGIAALLLYRAASMMLHGRKRRLPADLQAALAHAAEEESPTSLTPAATTSGDTAASEAAPTVPLPEGQPTASAEAEKVGQDGDLLSGETPAEQQAAASLSSDEPADVTEGEHEEASPQKIIPLLRRVEILIARKEYDEAKKILIRILSWQHDHPDASAHLAYLYLQTGQYSKAETLFRKVLEVRMTDPSLLTNFALAVLEQKEEEKIPDAVEALRMAVKLEPKNAERYSNLGQAAYLAGDLESAVTAFENAVKLMPRNLEYLFFLADSYLAVRNYSFAKRIFGRILEISPLNAEAKKELDALQHIDE